MATTTYGNYTPNRNKGGRGVGATNRASGGSQGVKKIRQSGSIIAKKGS